MCTAMCTAMVPADMGEAFVMLESVMGFLADADPAEFPVPVTAAGLQALERADAVEAVARARFLAVFSAQDGAVADGQRSTRTWLVHTTRVTRGQAGEYQATEALARDHQVLLAGLREGWVVTKSVALQLAKWTRPIPAEYRDEAEGILITAARAGADLRSLAAICAEIRARTAQPDPGNNNDHLDRGVSLDTTLDGAGVVHGDLTPECAAMVQAVEALVNRGALHVVAVRLGDEGNGRLQGEAHGRLFRRMPPVPPQITQARWTLPADKDVPAARPRHPGRVYDSGCMTTNRADTSAKQTLTARARQAKFSLG